MAENHGQQGKKGTVAVFGAGIAGLWYYEALDLPAAAADVATVELGVGIDLYETGVISVVNTPAATCGLERGMSVRDACSLQGFGSGADCLQSVPAILYILMQRRFTEGLTQGAIKG